MMLIARNCHFACEFLSVSFPTHDKLAGDLFTSLGARRSALLHFYSCSFLRRQSQKIVFMRFLWGSCTRRQSQKIVFMRFLWGSCHRMNRRALLAPVTCAASRRVHAYGKTRTRVARYAHTHSAAICSVAFSLRLPLSSMTTEI
jgi:hypothetical protein